MRKLSNKARLRLQRTSATRQRREIRRKVRRRYRDSQRQYLHAIRLRFAVSNNLPFDPRLDREQIIVPEVLSFADNHTATCALLNDIREKGLIGRSQIMLHFAHVRVVEPAATLVLVAEIHRLRSLRGYRAVGGTYPPDREVYDLLTEMGFYRLIEVVEPQAPRPVSDPGRPVFLRFQSSNRFDAELPDQFVGVVERQVMAMNEVARGRLVGAMKEAMQNTLDHAYQRNLPGITMEGRWWLSARVNVVNREVMVLMYDQGVGIPETLPAGFYDTIRSALSGNVRFAGLTVSPSDGAMIMAATKLYASRMPGSSRGRGFRNMQQFIDTCGAGELRVLSNKGSYSYMQDAENFSDHERSMGGTLIEWRFQSDGPVEMKDD